MEAYQIIAGFSDIKVAFRKKMNPGKSIQELQLWFTFDGNTLYVHDRADHKSMMALATFTIKSSLWHVLLENDSLGGRLVRHLLSIHPFQGIDDNFRREYDLHGFL